jgi:UDP-N-acetylglucosamine acyltransferase
MNNIHPTAIIGDNVEMGTGNTIGPYCVIGGDYFTKGGGKNYGKVYIGDNNVIVNHVVILPPFRTKKTVIGNDCEIYSFNFIGHDCILGDEVIMTAACRLAGVVEVQDMVNFGIGSMVHQRRWIGRGSMIGMGAVVVRDVLPFSKVVGSPAREIGLNEVLINRKGVSIEIVNSLRHAHKVRKDKQFCKGVR